MDTTDLPESQRTSRLTGLPAEIRAQIYTHLFEDWTLCVSITPKPPRSEDDTYDTHQDNGWVGGRPDVRATGFPAAVFHVCRGMYGDLMAMRPFPFEILQIDCYMNLASELRNRLGLALEQVEDRVDWTRASKVLVNQEGVHAVDVELVKRKLERLSAVEVVLRDVHVNAQYCAGWVRKALDQDSSAVDASGDETGWESSEFAFGYLHSFLGWRHPMASELCARKQARLLARQHVSVWSQRTCVARLVSLTDDVPTPCYLLLTCPHRMPCTTLRGDGSSM